MDCYAHKNELIVVPNLLNIAVLILFEINEKTRPIFLVWPFSPASSLLKIVISVHIGCPGFIMRKLLYLIFLKPVLFYLSKIPDLYDFVNRFI